MRRDVIVAEGNYHDRGPFSGTEPVLGLTIESL
jgi:hypothetical protein